MIRKAGEIAFDGKVLDVYSSMDDPLFVAGEVCGFVGYDDVVAMTDILERDEYVHLKAEYDGNKAFVTFLTEKGMYNILSQSRSVTARKWRWLIHEELIRARKESGKDISDQFDEWDEELDTIYYDEETDTLMQSVTVAGGDVVQVPFGRKEK